MAGNPNHPVSQELEGQWHKLAAIALHKLGVREIEIGEADIDAFMADLPYGAIVADARGGRLVLRLVSNAESERLVRESGGAAH